ncbi:MAG: PD-(D/E)XK nuclease domain-containing protein [Endomicrobium sp.]|jgi:hypothetical protein|nr:PD-(D/E)XK nuclease domain-containing protein [Endomicrobium sp.]
MEAREAFLTNILEYYSNRQSKEINKLRVNIGKQIREKDTQGLEESLRMLFGNIPYDLHIRLGDYYHSMLMMLTIVVGYEVGGEAHTDKGRIDAALKKGKEAIAVEIKYGEGRKVEQLLKEGMEQIKEKKYYEKYGSNEVCKFIGSSVWRK